MDFKSMQDLAMKVRDDYDALNKTKRGVQWNGSDLMAGFVGDVGDLSKIIMAKEGLRKMDDVDAKLAHELSDCLWSILVLAEKYNVDLEKEFPKVMKELEDRIKKEMA